jgi:hypothetical protein
MAVEDDSVFNDQCEVISIFIFEYSSGRWTSNNGLGLGLG